ncbi:hypothetical protein Ato02nite_061380 [Paractinoplanes toevensis]|uniref:Tetratricopeptide repeat protein n=2 Tax=Paractinoplanes toevensis TaxID=571911 RepID=A0A919TH82_9ACTN|nr:hypothetical protein Ato02nite_061380 [Actinoplanes toevensis]
MPPRFDRFEYHPGMLDFDGRFRMPEHPESLAAVREWEDTVAARQQQFGADDPRTVDSRLHLAEAYENLGRSFEAYENSEDSDDRELEALATAELAKAVDSRIRTLGPDHLDTLTIRYDLTALRLRQAVQEGLPGQDELVTEFRSIADVSARTLGHAHPMTLKARSQLSFFSPEPERSALKAQVVQGLEDVLAEQEQRLGSDDPQTLETMRRLVAAYRDDRGDEAQRLAERLIAGWERVAAARIRDLGPVHPDTVIAREQHLTYVNDWVSRGAAERLFEELVAEHVRLLGPDHPRTLHTQLELIHTWKGLYGSATPETITFAERLLHRFRDVLGPDHHDFLMLRYYLMSQRLIEGNLDAAFEIKRQYPAPADDEEK